MTFSLPSPLSLLKLPSSMTLVPIYMHAWRDSVEKPATMGTGGRRNSGTTQPCLHIVVIRLKGYLVPNLPGCKQVVLYDPLCPKLLCLLNVLAEYFPSVEHHVT